MMEYVIITPAKNEEKYIGQTLKSVTKQSLKPKQWIIVNDGSIDNTRSIVNSYVEEYPWINIVDSENVIGKSEGGSRVVNAFNVGYNLIEKNGFDFIVKLDADLDLPINYFEMVAECFELSPEVGMCGGVCGININGKLQQEYSANYHLRGALKAYRRECYEQIGGLWPVYMWDHLDEMKAMQVGWEIKILPIIVIHNKPTSTLINKGIKHSFKAGFEYYRFGYDFLLCLFRSVAFGLNKKPIVVTGFLFIFGFLYAMVTRQPKSVDTDLQEFMAKFQYERIINKFRSIFKPDE